MTAEALCAELNALDHEIEELSEQRIILTLTHPICLELRGLFHRRETLRAKLARTNVIPFRGPRKAHEATDD